MALKASASRRPAAARRELRYRPRAVTPSRAIGVVAHGAIRSRPAPGRGRSARRRPCTTMSSDVIDGEDVIGIVALRSSRDGDRDGSVHAKAQVTPGSPRVAKAEAGGAFGV